MNYRSASRSDLSARSNISAFQISLYRICGFPCVLYDTCVASETRYTYRLLFNVSLVYVTPDISESVFMPWPLNVQSDSTEIFLMSGEYV
jgi:hypothetical protein